MSEDRAYAARVAADGTATVRIVSDTSMGWNVQQVTVEMKTAPSGAVCSVRKNGVLISPVIPTGDAASGDPPIPLSYDDVMTVEFAGCIPGDIGKVYVVYEYMGLAGRYT